MMQISKYFEIPYRTIQDWEYEKRKCPDYLLNLMEYRIKNESCEDQNSIVHNRNEDMKELIKKHDLLQKERLEVLKKRSYSKSENNRAEWIVASALCNPYCSACKKYNERKSDFCPNCGKEMKK